MLSPTTIYQYTALIAAGRAGDGRMHPHHPVQPVSARLVKRAEDQVKTTHPKANIFTLIGKGNLPLPSDCIGGHTLKLSSLVWNFGSKGYDNSNSSAFVVLV